MRKKEKKEAPKAQAMCQRQIARSRVSVGGSRRSSSRMILPRMGPETWPTPSVRIVLAVIYVEEYILLMIECSTKVRSRKTPESSSSKEPRRPCHWGLLNGGCGFVGKSHPSHPLMALHPTVYKTSRAVWEKKFDE